MPRFFIILFFALFLLSQVTAQEEEEYVPNYAPTPTDLYEEKQLERHDFDQKKWESLKKGIDYTTSKPKKPEKEKTAKDPASKEDLWTFLKVLAIVIAVGLLVVLIVNMAGGESLFSPKNRKIKPAVTVSELAKIEENLHEAELIDPIQRAVASGDYPMAVRLYYLAVLKELSVRNFIRWKRDKTNGAYLRELAGSPMFGTVQEVTLAFERVWYGKVVLTKPDFEQLEKMLKKAVATASA